MRYTRLGSQGPEVSVLGLGCMGMGGTYGKVDENEAIRAVHAAVDAGVTLIDTAENYGPLDTSDPASPVLFGHANESFVGRALDGIRDKVVLSTKIGFEHAADGRRIGQNAQPAHIKKAVAGCLKRLRTEYLDLLYLHRVNPDVPIEDSIGAMADLVEEGKVRHLGLSEASFENLQKAQSIHPIAAQQSEYSLWERDVEDEELGLCRKLSIGFVAYAPLGRGFLAGSAKPAESYPANDYRRLEPRLQKGNYESNMKIAKEVQAMAEAKKISAAQLALAWLVHQGIVAIPGAEREAWARENAAAADIDLDEADLRRLDEIAPRGKTAGPRWGGQWASQLGRQQNNASAKGH